MKFRPRLGAKHFLARALLPLSILSLLAVSASGGLLTGAYGYFTSSATATATTTEGGTIGLSWNDTAATGSDLMVAVGPLMPMGAVQRIADLQNSGSLGIQHLQLSISGTAVGSSSDGIQLSIDRCSVPSVANDAVYTCPATITTVSPDRPVQATIAMTDSAAATRAGLDHLRFRLPDSAPESAQGLSGSVLIVADGSRG